MPIGPISTPAQQTVQNIAQKLPRDTTRLMGVGKQKVHPAAKTAADAWIRLHGATFHANTKRKKGA